MEAYLWWWIGALALGIVELITGTFYLLVLGLGFAVAGLAALAGLPVFAQLLVASGCAVAGWALLWRQGRVRRAQGDRENPDMLLDVGARLQIEHWDQPRSTVARYRGAGWQVELSDDAPGPGSAGPHLIRRIEGNRLIVSPTGR